MITLNSQNDCLAVASLSGVSCGEKISVANQARLENFIILRTNTLVMQLDRASQHISELNAVLSLAVYLSNAKRGMRVAIKSSFEEKSLKVNLQRIAAIGSYTSWVGNQCDMLKARYGVKQECFYEIVVEHGIIVSQALLYSLLCDNYSSVFNRVILLADLSSFFTKPYAKVVGHINPLHLFLCVPINSFFGFFDGPAKMLICIKASKSAGYRDMSRRSSFPEWSIKFPSQVSAFIKIYQSIHIWELNQKAKEKANAYALALKSGATPRAGAQISTLTMLALSRLSRPYSHEQMIVDASF
ncbi:hypothetical protein Q9247_09595 [Halomonas meridiana]|nr:hypothetical protein [Halomonas meridiana]MDP4557936.1 hypothetical protein [Halomonas meridiana]